MIILIVSHSIKIHLVHKFGVKCHFQSFFPFFFAEFTPNLYTDQICMHKCEL